MSRGRRLSRAAVFCSVSRRWGRVPAVEPQPRAGRAAGTRAALPLEGPARRSYRPRGCRACVAQIHRGASEPLPPCPTDGPSTGAEAAPGPPGSGPPAGAARREEPRLSRFVPRRPSGARGRRRGLRLAEPRRGRADPSRPRGTRHSPAEPPATTC